jgi:hypothetical protein
MNIKTEILNDINEILNHNIHCSTKYKRNKEYNANIVFLTALLDKVLKVKVTQ